MWLTKISRPQGLAPQFQQNFSPIYGHPIMEIRKGLYREVILAS